MNLFALADDAWLTIVRDVLTFLGTVFTGIMALYMARINQSAKTTAVATQSTADATQSVAIQTAEHTAVVAQKLDEIKTATDTTNEIVAANKSP